MLNVNKKTWGHSIYLFINCLATGSACIAPMVVLFLKSVCSVLFLKLFFCKGSKGNGGDRAVCVTRTPNPPPGHRLHYHELSGCYGSDSTETGQQFVNIVHVEQNLDCPNPSGDMQLFQIIKELGYIELCIYFACSLFEFPII